VPPVVREIRRYPVKSMAGESLPAVDLDSRGLVGDRWYAVVDGDGKLASGKPSRRFRRVPELMRHASRMDGDLPRVTLADGRSARADDEDAMATLVEAMAGPGWALRREAQTPHHDAAPVHIATTATLAFLSAAVGTEVTAERLRPNVLLDIDGEGPVEDGWVGRELTVGEVRLRVTGRTERCVMVDHVRPDLPALPARAGVLKAAGALNEACAGVYAVVLAPGRISAGDPVRLQGGR
jgi:uncharacterized protein YcbX